MFKVELKEMLKIVEIYDIMIDVFVLVSNHNHGKL